MTYPKQVEEALKKYIKETTQGTPWYMIVSALLVAYIMLVQIKNYIVYKKSGATLPIVRGDGCFGFRLLYEMLQQQKIGRGPDYLKGRFELVNGVTMRSRVAGRMALMTKDPELIKAVLATQFNDFALGTRHQSIKVTLGDGIFTLDGAGWKHSRAMLRPQFAREQVGHVQSLEPHVQALATRIRRTKGSKFDLQMLFFELTIDSGTEFLFGESCESLRDEDDATCDHSLTGLDPQVKRNFAGAFNYSQSMLFFRISLQMLYFIGDGLKFRRCNKVVHEFTDFYVKKALNASDKELEKLSRGGYVFLYELIKQTRDPIVLRDQCLNILLAARDTTAGLLSFVFFELARNPQILQKLREEIKTAFGEGIDADLSVLTFESLKRCDYLKWVLNETLRMYPSVPSNFRVAQRNTTLPRGGGPDGQSPIFVAKGTPVIYSAYSLHREEQYYGKDADVFRPERWGEPLAKKYGWAFVPFNGGPRICLGQQFALTEASYVTVRLLQLFPHLESFDTIYPPAKLTHLTMSLLGGCNVAMY